MSDDEDTATGQERTLVPFMGLDADKTFILSDASSLGCTCVLEEEPGASVSGRSVDTVTVSLPTTGAPAVAAAAAADTGAMVAESDRP